MRRIVLGALFASAAAWAADRPPIVPERDVDIHYSINSSPGGAPAEQRMRWLVAAGKLRVDPPTPGLYMIIDYPARRMAVVKPGERAVLDMATAAPGLPGAPAGSYTRLGADRVVGLDCSTWQTTDAAGVATVLCLTADGVMLRASQGGQTLVEAASVQYGPQDPAAFVPPDGYTHRAAQP